MPTGMEERLAALEAEVTRLRIRVAGLPPDTRGRTSPDFLDTMVGIFADDPIFEEVNREVEAVRERERVEARRLLAEDRANP